MTNFHRGPWADTSEAAIAAALTEVNTTEGQWVRLEYADGFTLVPVDPDHGWEIHVEVKWSEKREQYQAHLRRLVHFGDGV